MTCILASYRIGLWRIGGGSSTTREVRRVQAHNEANRGSTYASFNKFIITHHRLTRVLSFDSTLLKCQWQRKSIRSSRLLKIRTERCACAGNFRSFLDYKRDPFVPFDVILIIFGIVDNIVLYYLDTEASLFVATTVREVCFISDFCKRTSTIRRSLSSISLSQTQCTRRVW